MPSSMRESKALLGEDATDDGSDGDVEMIRKSSQLTARWWNLNLLVVLSLCNVLLFLATITALVVGSSGFLERRNRAWADANAYSPLTSQINIPLSMTQMRGPFLDEDHDIYRQLPSPEVDAAWENLTDHGVAYVSSDDIVKMGKDPAVVARLGPEFGLGPDAYMVETDIIHKIHCLNMIRKDVYFDHYWGEMYPDGIPTERHRWHTNHCLYIILQSLICDANTDLIPQVWLKDYPWPTPDFNINRKCGNLAGVKGWEREHRVDNDLREKMAKPHGQAVLPMSEELQRVFEVEKDWDAKHGV